jgi:sulfotransferase family protein
LVRAERRNIEFTNAHGRGTLSSMARQLSARSGQSVIQDRPIVVCGPGRSGTLTIRAMLNMHPDIQLAGEVPLRKLPSLKPLLRETADYQDDIWTEQRRAEVVRALWYATSRPTSGAPARRWGMKTPWAELDADFWDPLVNPLYVYALRRGDRVFQSRLRLGWHNGTPTQWIDRYKKSIRTFEALRSKGSAQLIQLDLIHSPKERRQTAEEMFAFVGEAAEVKVLERISEFSDRLNRPTSKPGEEPELPEEWRRQLAADDEYQELMASFGY